MMLEHCFNFLDTVSGADESVCMSDTYIEASCLISLVTEVTTWACASNQYYVVLPELKYNQVS